MAAIDVPINESEFVKSEQPLKPDPAKTADRKRLWRCLIGGGCVLVMAALLAAVFILWFVLQPKKPTVEFQDFTVSNFTAAPGLGSNNLPTQMLYMDVTAYWNLANPNAHFSTYFNGGLAKAGYGSLSNIAQSRFSSKFWVDAGSSSNFTSQLIANGYPLYNTGSLYMRDVSQKEAKLYFSAVFTTYVSVLWRLAQPRFTITATCEAFFNPVDFKVINKTCSMS